MIKLLILLQGLDARVRRKICNISSAAVIPRIGKYSSFFTRVNRDHCEKYRSGRVKTFKILIFAFVCFLLDTMPSVDFRGVNCNQVMVDGCAVELWLFESMA